MIWVQPYVPVAWVRPGYPTAMDGGSAENAGRGFRPWPVVHTSRRDVKSPLARFAHRCSPLARVNNLTQSILAKAFAKHIPVLCPSGQPSAVQNRSRRFCRGELTAQWRKDNPELISGESSAEALLERIKAERAAAKPPKKTRKRKTMV